MTTTGVRIDPNLVSQYALGGDFPAEAIWAFFQPSQPKVIKVGHYDTSNVELAKPPIKVKDELLHRCLPSFTQNPAFRDWRIPGPGRPTYCANAQDLKHHFARCLTGRYDVGPLHAEPAIDYTDFVVDEEGEDGDGEGEEEDDGEDDDADDDDDEREDGRNRYLYRYNRRLKARQQNGGEEGQRKRRQHRETNKSAIASKQLVIDVDATDYKGFRKWCGCDQGKSNMCDKCSRLMACTAQSICNMFSTIYHWGGTGSNDDEGEVTVHFSGARGFHIRNRAFEATILNRGEREAVADTLQRHYRTNHDFATLCQPLIDLERSLNYRLPDSIIIDRDVTVQMVKPTRGPFSIHAATGLFCFPIANPMEFTTPRECIPYFTSVVARRDPHAVKLFNAGRTLMERWTTTATTRS